MNKETLSAYIEGFTKRAQEAGLTEGQALDLCKEATSITDQLAAMVRDNPNMASALAGGIPGAAIGGAAGAAMTEDPKDRTRNALLAALAGGGAGAAGGLGYNASKDDDLIRGIDALLQQGKGMAQGAPGAIAPSNETLLGIDQLLHGGKSQV